MAGGKSCHLTTFEALICAFSGFVRSAELPTSDGLEEVAMQHACKKKGRVVICLLDGGFVELLRERSSNASQSSSYLPD